MHTKNKARKTLGPQAARLVIELHERSKALFSHADVAAITGLQPKSARNLIAGLVQRGVAARLQPGLFILVPFELGRESEYLGNPLLIARELAAGADYYISYASAMEIHRMTTQPQLIVCVVSPKAIRPRTILGVEFRFVRCKPAHLFGLTTYWATKIDHVRVSDLERTIIDGLKQPEYCGGFTEVAKAFWMRRDDIVPAILVDYALRLNVGAVIRRLGYLLEIYKAAEPHEIDRLLQRLTASYAVLDPLLPAEGKFNARWRIRLNVAPEEIEAVVRA